MYIILVFNSLSILQGGQEFLRRHEDKLPQALDLALEDTKNNPSPACNKDLGHKTTLRKMSRGHLFITRGSGIIDA